MSLAERLAVLTFSSDGWQVYRRLLSYLRPHLGMFCLGLAGAGMFSLTMVSFAWFAKEFCDTFETRNPSSVVWLPVGLVALFALRGLADFTQVYCMGYV